MTFFQANGGIYLRRSKSKFFKENNELQGFGASKNLRFPPPEDGEKNTRGKEGKSQEKRDFIYQVTLQFKKLRGLTNLLLMIIRIYRRHYSRQTCFW